MHEAKWWHVNQEQHIVCSLCPRHCELQQDQTGYCRVRKAHNNKLWSLVYAHPWSMAIDPIEKKPLYHFYPGSNILSIGTAGCNLSCKFCQNSSLVYVSANPGQEVVAPQDVIHIMKKQECSMVAFTYNEPTVFGEYVYDTAQLCKQHGLKTVMVTNGYIGRQARADIYEFIDAANVDLKAFTDEFYRSYTNATLAPVLETIQYLLQQNIWIELTTLLIPGVNDDERLLNKQFQYIAKEFGNDIVIHLSAFHPAHKLQSIPRTPLQTLKKAQEIAHSHGLQFVYLGNVPEHKNTYCPHCNKQLISRGMYYSIDTHLQEHGYCECGAHIAGVFA